MHEDPSLQSYQFNLKVKHIGKERNCELLLPIQSNEYTTGHTVSAFSNLYPNGFPYNMVSLPSSKAIGK